MGLSHIQRVQQILLNHGPLTVEQILAIIKSQTRQVPNSRQLNNILSKNPKMFFKAGKQKTSTALRASYHVIIWCHVNYEEEE